MLDSVLDDLVQVAVPRRHLMAVYGLLTQLDGTPTSDSENGVASADDEDVAEATWTVEKLRRFALTPTATSTTIGKVLDVLAQRPTEYLSTTELEKETGVPRSNLKGAFSALTRHIKKHYEGLNWMLDFEWGPSLGSDYPAEGHYMLSEVQAARWKEARENH